MENVYLNQMLLSSNFSKKYEDINANQKPYNKKIFYGLPFSCIENSFSNKRYCDLAVWSYSSTFGLQFQAYLYTDNYKSPTDDVIIV